MIPVIQVDVLEFILEQHVFNGVELVRRQSQQLNSRRYGPTAGTAEKFVDFLYIASIVFLDDRGMNIIKLFIAVFLLKVNEKILMGGAELV